MKLDACDALSNTQEQIIARSLILLVDGHGIIQAVNGGWNPFATPVPGKGGSCFDFLASSNDRMTTALREVLDGRSPGIRIETSLPASLGQLWCETTIHPLPAHDSGGAVITCLDITARKQSAQALGESEERYRVIVDHEPECVKIVDLDGNLREMNPAGLKIIEAESLSQVVGQPVINLVHPDDRGTFLQLHQKVCAGEAGRQTFRVTGLQGRLSWVETHSVPLRDPDGNVTSVLSVTHDITQRKDVEERLRGANLRYERQRTALARLMRGGVMQAVDLDEALRKITAMIARTTAVERVSIWRFDEDRSAIVCQELFEAAVERHSSGVVLYGRDYPAYFHALEKNEMISTDDARIDPRTAEFTSSYLEPQGITSMLDAPIHVNGVLEGVLCQEHVGPPRTWTPEEQSFAMSMANLISLVLAQWHRRQIEEQLRQQASLLDKAQDAILVRDLDHTITYWNKSAENLYGWTTAEALGRKISELIYRDDAEFWQATNRVFADGEWTGEIRQRNKAGEEVIVEGRWTLVHDAAGEPKCILAINTNITEKKQLEAQFLRAQRMESIGTLAGGIAHDLNNVLTPILMSIDLLKLRITDAASRETLRTIATSAQRGAEMIRQVLSFAKGVEGRRLPVQFSSILQDITRITRDTFPKNIHLDMQALPELWTVSGDTTQIHQVLLNLCVNARDAMPTGGALAISAENIMIDAHYAAMNIEAREGPHVMIGVTDEGGGIPREIIDKIFDPFFTTKETGKGTGLGLSTSLAIVKGHGGFIRASSEPGHGARFQVYLPAEPVSVMAQPPATELPLPRGNHELVLVVDDEAVVRDITQQTLEGFGYRVLLAADGAEAVTLYSKQQNEIAVVLTDMMMPVMDGATTIRVLMKLNPKVRIIAASGIASNGSVAKAAEAGVTHFLPKPYTAETLLRSLHQILAET